jgi:hypothetical protein
MYYIGNSELISHSVNDTENHAFLVGRLPYASNRDVMCLRMCHSSANFLC